LFKEIVDARTDARRTLNDLKRYLLPIIGLLIVIAAPLSLATKSGLPGISMATRHVAPAEPEKILYFNF